MCCVESIPPWAINQKILPGPNRVKVQLKLLEFCKLYLIKTKSLLFSILMRLIIGMSKVETNTFKILRSIYCALYPVLLIV